MRERRNNPVRSNYSITGEDHQHDVVMTMRS
jgi:hypothetical protein